MILTVHHTTRYRYDAPVRWILQSLRMTPSMSDGQDIINWDVSVPGATFGASFTDGAGDKITTVSTPGPTEEVTVTVTGKVETEDTAGVLKGHRERISPLVYLTPSSMTKPDAALRALAAEVKGKSLAPLDHSHALSHLVAERVRYLPGVTEATTTAAEALQAGQGVCQDQAQVLCAVARLNGLPARYISGYLQADEFGQAHDAAHAWAEIHIDGLGWVGFDVANHCCPDEKYIRVGSGLDALDAAPIRGTAYGPSSHRVEVSVAVTAKDK
ncbi:transglutaminase family protein [Paracoccaceae bacterium GXU_MW_L88]